MRAQCSFAHALGATMSGTIFSFVVDDAPRFAREGRHLARSLVRHCGGDPSAVHVQCTPEVDAQCRSDFRRQGYSVHEIARFADGRHCNKVGQLENLRDADFDRVVLLDTDTIAIADLRPFLGDSAISSKIVDASNPPLSVLREIAHASGLTHLPATCRTDSGDGDTFAGNCNGGFYAVPRRFCDALSREWRRWTRWLVDDIGALRRAGCAHHADQVGFWLATQHGSLPFSAAPSNLNYYVHFTGAHEYFDARRDIALLHYHDSSVNADGLLEPPAQLTPLERAAVARANAQIAESDSKRVSLRALGGVG